MGLSCFDSPLLKDRVGDIPELEIPVFLETTPADAGEMKRSIDYLAVGLKQDGQRTIMGDGRLGEPGELLRLAEKSGNAGGHENISSAALHGPAIKLIQM